MQNGASYVFFFAILVYVKKLSVKLLLGVPKMGQMS